MKSHPFTDSDDRDSHAGRRVGRTPKYLHSPKTFDIGVATPLTGPAAHIGMNMKNAVLMAIEDQNVREGSG